MGADHEGSAQAWTSSSWSFHRGFARTEAAGMMLNSLHMWMITFRFKDIQYMEVYLAYFKSDLQ